MSINYVKNEKDLTVTLTMPEEMFEEYFCFCAECGELIQIRDAVRIDGEYYHMECCCVCDICGRYISRSNSFHTVDSGRDFCEECFLNETFQCHDCGARFRYEDELRYIGEYEYCDDCYEAHAPIIRDYHDYKNSDSIEFYGDEDRRDVVYLGYEIEVDTDERVDSEEVATLLQQEMGSLYHYERDGSLSSRGIEIISAPSSINYHLSMLPKVKKAFQILTENSYKGHDAHTSTGMHFHIDRRFFGKREDSSIAKLLFIFERHRKDLLVFSRRLPSQCEDWCRSRTETYSNNAGWIKKAVMSSKGFPEYSSRYYSVNLNNSDTVEIRLWRSSLNPQTFEATLKFTARLAQLCRDTRAVDLAKFTFDDLLGDDPTIRAYWNRISNK